jgi:hypothetical protein
MNFARSFTRHTSLSLGVSLHALANPVSLSGCRAPRLEDKCTKNNDVRPEIATTYGLPCTRAGDFAHASSSCRGSIFRICRTSHMSRAEYFKTEVPFLILKIPSNWNVSPCAHTNMRCYRKKRTHAVRVRREILLTPGYCAVRLCREIVP